MHVPSLIRIDNLVESNRRARLSRRVLSTISEEASKLEDLLTDYDAPYNHAFCKFYELVAALRSFSAAGYTAKVVELRTARRPSFNDKKLDAAFREETAKALGFIEEGVRQLLRSCRSEVEKLSGTELEEAAPQHIFQDSMDHRSLPHTLGADDVTDQKSRIAAEASLFLTAHQTLHRRSQGARFDDPELMQRFVLDVCDEEQSRFFEVKLQNIQSRYDTFVMNTLAEKRDPLLREFRVAVGNSLELIRIVARLVHFFERHEDDSRPEEAKAAVAQLVDKQGVLDTILNYALYYAHRFMEVGEPLAESLLQKYTVKESVALSLPAGVVLHARPASLIVKVVQHHGTPVQIQLGDHSCYAGSITQIIMAAGQNPAIGSVKFEGDRKPIADLTLLFEHRLGEDGLDNLPPDLSYLRR